MNLDELLRLKTEQVQNALALLQDNARREVDRFLAQGAARQRELQERMDRERAVKQARLEAEAADRERELLVQIAARRQALEELERVYATRKAMGTMLVGNAR